MTWNGEKLLTAINASNPRHCITEEALAGLTGLKPSQVTQSASTLIGHGLMEKTSKGCLRLTRAGRLAVASGASIRSKRALKDTLRVRVWRAIRIRRKFSVPDLISLVADESARGDITSNVQKYVRALWRAGYVLEMQKREPGTALTSNGYKRWWLLDTRDSGPQAPVWNATRQTVYDPNTGETRDISGAEEATPPSLPLSGEEQ